jgi:hypothetical protein
MSQTADKDRRLAALRTALASFLVDVTLVEALAEVLHRACENGRVSYQEVQNVVGADPVDILMAAYEWKLLVPAASARGTLDWEDKLLRFSPGETYLMPSVVRHLVETAEATSRWEPARALTAAFAAMGEVELDSVTVLVRSMAEQARYLQVDGRQIRGICDSLGLGDKAGALIAELKASGAMSPRLGSLGAALKAKAPVYELNPCLLVSTKDPDRL